MSWNLNEFFALLINSWTRDCNTDDSTCTTDKDFIIRFPWPNAESPPSTIFTPNLIFSTYSALQPTPLALFNLSILPSIGRMDGWCFIMRGREGRNCLDCISHIQQLPHSLRESQVPWSMNKLTLHVGWALKFRFPSWLQSKSIDGSTYPWEGTYKSPSLAH